MARKLRVKNTKTAKNLGKKILRKCLLLPKNKEKGKKCYPKFKK
jgi:hypothetical protein